MIEIRRINIGEGELYKKMRLASLTESPGAFSTTFSEASKRNIQSWEDQSDSGAQGSDRVTMVAFNDSQPAGIGSVYRDPENEYCSELIQFWIDPSCRGGKVAPELIKHLIYWSQQQNCRKLITWVNYGNLKAIKFYQKYGFVMTDQVKPFRMGSQQVACLMELIF